MKKHPSQARRRGLLATALAAVIMAMCILLSPTQAKAATYYAHTNNGYYYADMKELIEDLSSGITVYMDSDWEISNAIRVEENRRATVYMNGHTIKNTSSSGDSNVFRLENGANLDLLGDPSGKKYEITYEGYVNVDQTEQITTTTGGLLTSSKGVHKPLVYGKGNNIVSIDGVTIGGAYTYDNDRFDEGGAISLRDNCTLYMRNGASVEHNCSGKSGYRGPGGGINISKNGKIVMNNATIHDNYADNCGGGIYSHGKDFKLEMYEGSSIDNNHAGAGGGIYIDESSFTITGDGTGSVSGNTCWNSSTSGLKSRQSGGGIHVDSTVANNEGLIENIKICNNYSAYDGGGLELDQRWTTVRNCTITGNTCKYEGGGIYDCNSDNLIDGCTITGNACNVDSGGNYEGGGIFVWYSYDIKLSGKCMIYNNTRGKNGSADDVFLRENGGATAKAYITGSLSNGSLVGVRTGITGDRRIAKNFKPETKDCLFYDMDGYYVSYGSDEGGDAWQRHTTLEFAAKINGETKARFKNGTHAVLLAESTKGDDQIFWYWDTKTTTGLYPVEYYISDKSCFNTVLGFTMPQNDVNATALYASRAKQVLVGIEAPVKGNELPKTAEVRRADAGLGGNVTFTMPVTWYEVNANGEKTAAAGTAKADTTYVASITCAQSIQYGLYFSKSLTAGAVTVKTTTGSDAKAESAKVDEATGALTVEVGKFQTEKDPEEPPLSELDLKIKKKGYFTYDDVPTALAASDDSDSQASDDLLGTFKVSIAGASDVTVTAPVKEGYNFCNWDNVPDGWVKDDEAGTLTIPAAALGSLDKYTDIAAYYTPVVTEVEIAVNQPAPVAGKKLATVAASMTLTATDGSKIDLIDAVGKDECDITWYPESEGGTADYSTSYTALIKLAAADGLAGVENVLATDAVVKVSSASGMTVAQAAGFTVIDDQLCLAFSFPATSDLGVKSVSQPEAVEVSFEDAVAYQAEGSWPLPRTVTIELENDEKVDGDVTWEAVEGFDANATAAQEFTVKGTVTNIAYEGAAIETDGYDPNVTVTVKVAAPAGQASGEDGDEAEPAEPVQAETIAQAKAAFKKGTPSTGDATRGGIAGLCALAAVCLVAARLSRRKS